MSLIINHNLMAMTAARNLSQAYGNLSTSVNRLSSGLRITTAADDAAGLAIRELMRADIASLNQGVRNANDAISMIQTADGALQVIDEKLIRMKELAEQAATGTYTSDQRLIIDSEYQQMASEITRIANATDFNGIYLLNGNLSSDTFSGSGLQSTGKLKVHFGTANDSAEDYYYIKIGTATASALGVGNSANADLNGYSISTQEGAQKALDALNKAIISKDKIRANEMTNFVRNQILTQSAVAMLSQANTLPQMALQLMQG
jgi:flagellin